MALRLGTRGSQLALYQARAVASLVKERTGVDCEIVVIKTSGDRLAEAPLSQIGGKRLFVKEIEDALLESTIDLAVHSSKDMAAVLPEGLTIAGVLPRENPLDAVVLPVMADGSAMTIELMVAALGPSPSIGTGSVRRAAQLVAMLPGVAFVPIRGNVDTRVRKLDEGQYDVLVLACAGLRRLGLENRISAAVLVTEMLPAVGQGALGIETRADDAATIAAVSKLDHKFTRLACTAERAFLRSLGGGCQLPIAAHAVVREKRIRLDGLVADPQGRRIVRDRISGSLDEAERLGTELGERLLELGARELLESPQPEG